MIYFTLKTMEISQYPPNPKDWTPELIYEICNRSDVESETFDLKLEPTKLTEEEHLRFLDMCSKDGCTPSAFIKKLILGDMKSKNEELPDMAGSELRKLLELIKKDEI